MEYSSKSTRYLQKILFKSEIVARRFEITTKSIKLIKHLILSLILNICKPRFISAKVQQQVNIWIGLRMFWTILQQVNFINKRKF